MANNKQQPKKPTPKEGVREWRGADSQYVIPVQDLPRFYANNAKIEVNNWDFTILFGQILDTSDETKLTVEAKASITMSLQFALALRDSLVKNIELFENKFGKIQNFLPDHLKYT